MASTSMPEARSRFRFTPIKHYDYNQADVVLSDRRYQQLELKHKFDRGVCGAMEFR